MDNVKLAELTDFFRDITEDPPFEDCARLSFHIARKFKGVPTADPDDYSEEIEALCDELSLDSDDMTTLVAGKVDSVKFPIGQVYAHAVTKAVKQPQRFRVTFKGKRFFMINIIYYLSDMHQHDLFNIPAEMIATSAKTTKEVVYAFITELIRRNFLAVVEKEDIARRKGRLFKWLEPPS